MLEFLTDMIDYSKNISKSNILDVEINRKSFVLPEGRPFSGLEGEFVQIFRYPVSYEMHTKETLAAVELAGQDWKLGGTQWLPSEKIVEEFEEAASESISEIVEETKKTQDNVEEISLLQSSEDVVEETTVTQFEVEKTLDVTVDMVYSESSAHGKLNDKEKESREKFDQGASEKIIDLEVDRTSTITEEKVTLSDGISVKLEEPVKSSPSKKKWWTPKKDFLTPKKESKTPKKSPKSKTKLSFSYFRSGSPVNSSEDESDFDAQSGLTIVTFCIIINISFNLIIGFCVIHRRILPSRMVSFSTQDLLNRALANRTVIRSIPLTSEICTSIHWVFSSETSGWTVKATKLACSFVVSTSKARHGSTDTCSATISWLKSTVAR